MDDVNIVTESVIHIEEVKRESDSHLEDPLWIYTDLDESSSLKSLVMEEDEEVELKPPVSVFVETTNLNKEDVAEEYEDPLTICKEGFSDASVREKEDSNPSGCSYKERSKRKRSRNFDESDKLLVLDLAIDELEILCCKQTDQVSNEKKRNAWLRICTKYNASSPLSGPRNVEQLKALYDMLGRNARKDKAKAMERRERSGGTGPLLLSETTLKILEMIKGIKPVQKSGLGSASSRSGNCVGHDEAGVSTSDKEIKRDEKDVMERLASPKPTRTQPVQIHTKQSPSLRTSSNIPLSDDPTPAHGIKIVQVTSTSSPMLETDREPSNSRNVPTASHFPVHKPRTIRTPMSHTVAQRQRRYNHSRLFDLKCRKEEQIIKNLEKEYEERSKRCQLLDVELEIKKADLAIKVQELDKIKK